MRVKSHFQPHGVTNMELFSKPNISENKTSNVKEYNLVLFFSIFGTELLVQGLNLDNCFIGFNLSRFRPIYKHFRVSAAMTTHLN